MKEVLKNLTNYLCDMINSFLTCKLINNHIDNLMDSATPVDFLFDDHLLS